MDNSWEFAGSLDRIDLMSTMLNHPYLPLRVEIGDELHVVAGFRYTPERGGLVLLLHEVTREDLCDYD